MADSETGLPNDPDETHDPFVQTAEARTPTLPIPARTR